MLSGDIAKTKLKTIAVLIHSMSWNAFRDITNGMKKEAYEVLIHSISWNAFRDKIKDFPGWLLGVLIHSISWNAFRVQNGNVQKQVITS